MVDSDSTDRESLTSTLERTNLDVRSYPTPEAFLPEAFAGATGCLVMDLHLPGMGGLAFLEWLRARDRLLPAIVLIPQGDVRSAVKAMHAGAAACVQKPFVRQVLLNEIRRCMASSGNGRTGGSRQSISR